MRLIRQTPQKLIELNFFLSRYNSSPLTLHTERRATRLYIIIWTLVFATFLLFSLLAKQTRTVEVSQPNETLFAQLYASHNASLHCPCTALRFPIGSFLHLDVRLHQICSSAFIEDAWRENIYNNGTWSNLPSNQFRIRGVTYFVTQQSLCLSARRAVNRTVLEFLGNAEFNEKMIPEDQLVLQSTLAVDRIKNWNKNHFKSMISVLRGGIQTNQLINIFFSNWIYLPQHHADSIKYRFLTAPVSHNATCSCAVSSTCTEPTYVDSSILSGFVLGCNPIESLLRSTLSCLYNETCVQLINFANLSLIKPLDLSLLTRYDVQSTVDDLTSNAFVEEWHMNVSYSGFFTACAPAICTYTVSELKPIMEMITLILGLYAGLTLILRVIVPWLVRGLEKALQIYRRHNHRVTPLT